MTTPQPVRVLELRTVNGFGGGPDKTILNGAAAADPSQFAVTVCYVRDLRDTAFAMDRHAKRLNVDFVEVQEAHSADWTVVTRLRELVRCRRIDIVHAHEYKSDLLALLLARSEGVAALATVHGWTGHSRRERWVYYPADKRLLRRFPRLIAVSSQIRDELTQHGVDPRRVTVLLNGIDHRRFTRMPERRAGVRERLGLTAEDVVVGSVGRVEPQKRFDLLLDVFASLLRARPTLRLVIAGEGSLRAGLERRAADLGVGAACRFLGHCEDVADLHNGFDLFVQASDYEGTSNAVIEAMACGTPIVATDVGGTRELARPDLDALIVPPRDPAALRAAVESCLDEPARTIQRANAARKRIISDLSFDTRVAKVEQIYCELSAARRLDEPRQVSAAGVGC